MAVRTVVMYPDDPLTLKATPYESVGPEIAELAEDMLETMAAYNGVGLAGPQIGWRKRIFVMREPDGQPLCFVNPEILASEGEELGEEGCLSMPEVFADVPRATWLRVRALSECGEQLDFEITDFAARIVQHEIDHLDGILFPDRLDILTRQAKLQEWEDVRARLEVESGE